MHSPLRLARPLVLAVATTFLLAGCGATARHHHARHAVRARSALVTARVCAIGDEVASAFTGAAGDPLRRGSGTVAALHPPATGDRLVGGVSIRGNAAGPCLPVSSRQALADGVMRLPGVTQHEQRAALAAWKPGATLRMSKQLQTALGPVGKLTLPLDVPGARAGTRVKLLIECTGTSGDGISVGENDTAGGSDPVIALPRQQQCPQGGVPGAFEAGGTHLVVKVTLEQDLVRPMRVSIWVARHT